MANEDRTDEITALVDEYQVRLEELGLPKESADDLLCRDDLTVQQREYLSDFYVRWEEAAEREQEKETARREQESRLICPECGSRAFHDGFCEECGAAN